MLTFAVVASAGRGRLPAPTLARLRDAADTGSLDHHLVHPVESRHLWVDDASSVAVIGWWSGWDGIGAGRPWHEGPGLTAFSGRAWPRGIGWSTGETWAAQLDAYLERGGERAGRPGLSGHYCAVHLGPEGRGRVIADDFGMRAIYHGVRQDVHVAGSHARVVATLLADDREPPRDPVGAGWLAYLGVVLDDARTGYVDVHRVPHGAHLEVDPSGVRVVDGPTPFDLHPHRERSVAEAVAVLSDDLQHEMKVASRLSGQEVAVGLSGGKDSRTLLAAALMAGVADRFGYYTFGRPGLPDRIVADRLRARYGLRELEHPNRTAETGERWRLSGRRDRRDGVLRSVFASAGVQSVGAMQGPSGPVPRVSITGIGGEVLSTNYPFTDHATTPDDLYQFLYRGLKAGATGLVRDDVVGEYDRIVDGLAEEVLAETDDVREAIDRLYLRVQLRSFFGTVEEWDVTSRVCPLMDSSALAVARSIGSSARRSEVLEYSVMAAADPELPHLPFAEDAWNASLPEHLDRGHVPADMLRPPLAPPPPRTGPRPRRTPVPLRPPTSTGATKAAKATAASQRRVAVAEEHAALFQAHLVDEPTNPAFDVLDYDAVVAVVAQFPDIPPIHERHLFGALTAAIWIGGHDLRPFD